MSNWNDYRRCWPTVLDALSSRPGTHQSAHLNQTRAPAPPYLRGLRDRFDRNPGALTS